VFVEAFQSTLRPEVSARHAQASEISHDYKFLVGGFVPWRRRSLGGARLVSRRMTEILSLRPLAPPVLHGSRRLNGAGPPFGPPTSIYAHPQNKF
jgi:hypothetical protein